MNSPFPQESHIREMLSLGLPRMYMTKPTGIWRTNRAIREEKLCKCVYTSFVYHRSEWIYLYKYMVIKLDESQ